MNKNTYVIFRRLKGALSVWSPVAAAQPQVLLIVGVNGVAEGFAGGFLLNGEPYNNPLEPLIGRRFDGPVDLADSTRKLTGAPVDIIDYERV